MKIGPFYKWILLVFGIGLAFAENSLATSSVHNPNFQDPSKKEAFFDNLSVVHGAIDIIVRGAPGSYGLCQASTIENTVLRDNPQVCRASLITAAHCIVNLARYMGGNGVNFELPGEQQVAVTSEKLKTYLPPGALTQGPDNTAKGNDFGVFTVTSLCSHLKFLKPVSMAPAVKPGTKSILGQICVQKRLNPIPPDPQQGYGGNSGNSKRLAATYAGSHNGQVFYDIAAGALDSIVSGDSGGWLLDGLGHLIGTISGSSSPDGFPGRGGSTSISFAPGSTVFAQKTIASLEPGLRAYYSPEPVEMGPNSSCSTPNGSSQLASRSAIKNPVPEKFGNRFGNPSRLSVAPIPANEAAAFGPNPQATHGELPQSSPPLDSPSNGERYLVKGKWLPWIPLDEPNVVGINGVDVAPGAIGYTLGPNNSVRWVTGDGSQGSQPRSLASVPDLAFAPSTNSTPRISQNRPTLPMNPGDGVRARISPKGGPHAPAQIR